MRYTMYVELAGFYLRTLGLEDRPAVVHEGDRLLDVSASARARKLTLDRTLREAKLLLREGAVCVAFRPEEFRAAAARWLDLALAYSGVIEPLSPAAALIDLSQHPRPSDVAGRFLGALHRQERLPIRAGVAASGWLARLAAAPCSPQSLALDLLPVEPVADAKAWLAERPISELAPFTAELRSRFERLGLVRAGDLQALPFSALRRQFGALAPWIAAVAEGRHGEPVLPAWPPAGLSLTESLERCEDREQLDEALHRLARRAAAALAAQDRTATGLTLFVALESQAVLAAKREFKQAAQRALAIRVHLRQALESLALAEPVERVRVVFADLRPAARSQAALPFALARDRPGASEAVRQLQHAFGSGAVVVASSIVQSRERRVLKAWKDAYGWT